MLRFAAEGTLDNWATEAGIKFESWTVNADIDAVRGWCEVGTQPTDRTLWDVATTLIDLAVLTGQSADILEAMEVPGEEWDMVAFDNPIDRPTSTDYAAVRHALCRALSLMTPQLDDAL